MEGLNDGHAENSIPLKLRFAGVGCGGCVCGGGGEGV